LRSPAFTHGSIACRAASARASGLNAPVESKYDFTLSYCCGGSGGIASGSSGASFASASIAHSTLETRVVKSFVATTACFGPNELCTFSVAVDTPPAVEMRLSANRTFAVYPPPMFT
jgi:hypothetical protein